jgi:hypothetical protein
MPTAVIQFWIPLTAKVSVSPYKAEFFQKAAQKK